MSGILAIEADPKRQTLLKALLDQHAPGEATIVESVEAAIVSFAKHQPDLIVAPTLLTPADSDRLISHVKEHAEPHVQVLSIAALDILREPPIEQSRRLRGFRRHQPVRLGLQYDPQLVGTLIAERLERARALRSEQTTIRHMREVPKAERPVRVRPDQKRSSPVAARVASDRRCAARTPQAAVSWLSSVRLPWGTDVNLVNISRTGILVESGSKLSVGVKLELHLAGRGVNRVVLARFIRSEVARVDRLGVRYHAAAQFEEPLELCPARTEPTAASAPQSITDLFTTVVADTRHADAASKRFAQGLSRMIGARDVFIGDTPIPPAADCESIYFRVKSGDRSGAILQVMFDHDRALTGEEFRLLKAAAGLTCALLELERESVVKPPTVTRQMAEVA